MTENRHCYSYINHCILHGRVFVMLTTKTILRWYPLVMSSSFLQNYGRLCGGMAEVSIVVVSGCCISPVMIKRIELNNFNLKLVLLVYSIPSRKGVRVMKTPLHPTFK